MASTRREVIGGLGTSLLLSGRIEAAPAPMRFVGAEISAGKNRPGLQMYGVNDALLAYYHLRFSRSRIARELKLSATEIDQRTDALIREGLARRLPDGRVGPTALVLTKAEKPRFLYVRPRLVRDTVDAIEAALPDVRRRYAALPAFAHIPFADASLLVLSNALLDNWQIDRVEAQYLKVPRPLRGGGRYYYAVFEAPSVDKFGIYGNHNQRVGDVTLCLYGNQRYAGPVNLIALQPSDLSSRFGFAADTRVQDAQKALVDDLVRRWRDPSAPVDEARVTGLRQLGLLAADGRTAIPVLGLADIRGLDAMAAAFAPALLAIFEKNRSALEAQHRNSPYAANGVSFPEFFIWWYHLFYTGVTDELARRGMIAMPRAGTVTYLITS